MSADSEQSETFEEQPKMSADILKYFEEYFLCCNAVGIVFSGIAADRL